MNKDAASLCIKMFELFYKIARKGVNNCTGWCLNQYSNKGEGWEEDIIALTCATRDRNRHGKVREISKARGIKNIVISDDSVVICCNWLRDTIRNLRKSSSKKEQATDPHGVISFRVPETKAKSMIELIRKTQGVPTVVADWWILMNKKEAARWG